MKWWWNKATRRVSNGIFRRFYRETNDDPAQVIFLAGVARSGTTWLAEIVASQLPCRIMFEPFHAGRVDAYGSRFPNFLYRRPDDFDPDLLAYATRVFSGRIRHPWIDREVNRLVTSVRLVKEVRASLTLCWLQQQFPAVPFLFLIRHPCAVVLSHIEAGWSADEDLDAFLAQPALLADFLEEHRELIQGAKTEEEKLAVGWALQHSVLRQHFGKGNLDVVFYEHLCRPPETEIDRTFALIDRPYADSVFHHVQRPSRMTARSSAVLTGEDLITRWQSQLTSAQIKRILAIVAAFGLDDLYGDAVLPQGVL